MEEDGWWSNDQLLLEEDQNNPTGESSEMHSENNLHTTNGRIPKDLKLDEKRHIVDTLLALEKEDALPWGSKNKLARQMGVHRSTISRIFNDAKAQRRAGAAINVSSKKFGTVGRKPIEYSEQWLQSVPLHLRTTERAYAGYLKVAPVTIHRLKKRGILRSHTSNNHPTITQQHKIKRIQWVLAHTLPATRDSKACVDPMINVIHIDEKWFYLNPDMRRFYILPKEEDPYRCCQSKRYKIKAMFMGVIGRPLYDNMGNMIHDGKYGIYPFVYTQRAKKSSKNRKAGTLETKATQNIGQEVIRDILINKVIPSIINKWPAQLDRDITVQWDNARPHKIPVDSEFKAACTQQGLNIKLVFQPPQSPDLNVLGLGLFRAIQSLQYKSFPKNIEELIDKVEEAYDNFDPVVNKYCWLTLQHVMVEILKVKGGNEYKIPHNGKRELDRLGLLPDIVEVYQHVVDEAVAYLNERIIVVNAMNTVDGEELEVDAD